MIVFTTLVPDIIFKENPVVHRNKVNEESNDEPTKRDQGRYKTNGLLVKYQRESIPGLPTKNWPRSIMIMKVTPVCLKVVAQFARREINVVKLSKFVTKPE